MTQMPRLNDPWLVAVWPGMGGVARIAGEYLAAKLRMRHVGEFPTDRFFELSHIDVHKGLARAGSRPRCPVFVWHDPRERHDLILLLGEAQPPTGGYRLCEQVIEQAGHWGVSRIIAFAAMATQMHPGQRARVFSAATRPTLLDELASTHVEPLAGGQIGGMNGLMLAAAQQNGLEAMCLLGELPYFATQVPNPKASSAVLGVLVDLLGFKLDFTDLDEQAKEIDSQLIRLVEQLQQHTAETEAMEVEEGEFAVPEPAPAEDEEEADAEPARLHPQAQQRIEQLFDQAHHDRSKAFQLKRELDRLNVFEQYEDRFLDLFKRGG